jgi:hypothetical protein
LWHGGFTRTISGISPAGSGDGQTLRPQDHHDLLSQPQPAPGRGWEVYRVLIELLISNLLEGIMELNDKLFRIAILIISIAFLIIYYEGTQNGRYKYYASDETMLDSRTGKTYYLDAKKWKWILEAQPSSKQQ